MDVLVARPDTITSSTILVIESVLHGYTGFKGMADGLDVGQRAQLIKKLLVASSRNEGFDPCM